MNNPVARSGSSVSAGNVNLEVPIEMLQLGTESATTATIFKLSRTSFDTGQYDGTITYSFEVVAQNNDSVSRNVRLVNSTGAVTASIPVSAGTSAPTLLRALWSPSAGANDYRISLDGTTVAGDLKVFAARLLVKQAGASKTRIYIPLASNGSSITSSDDTGAYPVDSINSVTYSQGVSSSYSIWRKDSAVWKTLQAGTPWTFEAILETGYASLFNRTTGQQIVASEVSTTAGFDAMALVSASFSDSATNFADANEMEVRIKNNTAWASVYKAGLWVSLTNLSKGEVYYTTSRLMSCLGSAIVDSQASVVDTANFSNPNVFYETTLHQHIAGAQTVGLYDGGNTTSGVGSLVDVPAALITVPGSHTRIRTSALALPAGHRYISYTTESVGCEVLTRASLVVGFSSL